MSNQASRHGVVTVPVTDLRREPVDACPGRLHDELEESQLLFNELLLIKDEISDWYYVEAGEQKKFTAEKGWHPYPGWVRKKHVREIALPPAFGGVTKGAFTLVRARADDDAIPLLPLSLGTKLVINGEEKGYYRVPVDDRSEGWVPKRDVRRLNPAAPDQVQGRDIGLTARLFLGVPYLWGGRSVPLPGVEGTTMGVDCSGLINLVFRAEGIDIPRDAHDQWMVAREIDGSAPEEGDLIFVPGPGETDIVAHVMLYLSGERFVEAAETGDVVRINTFGQRFGVDLARFMEAGFMVNGRKLFFRRISGQTIKD